ncbi:MAG: DUF350 domain-containing protein [Candidatus Micrarchaeota archaeon]
MAKEILIHLIVSLVRIFAAIVLSAGAVYTGISLVDRMTARIDEWKEIKKGNLALGILFAAVVASVILLCESRIVEAVFAIGAGVISPLNDGADTSAGAIVFTLELMLITFVNYIIALGAASFVVFLSINVIDRITPDLDELAELKKGNLAVALILAVSLLLVAFALREPFESLFDLLKSIEVAILEPVFP